MQKMLGRLQPFCCSKPGVSALAQGGIDMDIRLFQGQPVLVLERLGGGSVKCCAVSSGRGLPFEFITQEDALMPEEPRRVGEAQLAP
jgi:hypothetical protein